jgi:hypothetical protein
MREGRGGRVGMKEPHPLNDVSMHVPRATVLW